MLLEMVIVNAAGFWIFIFLPHVLFRHESKMLQGAMFLITRM